MEIARDNKNIYRQITLALSMSEACFISYRIASRIIESSFKQISGTEIFPSPTNLH